MPIQENIEQKQIYTNFLTNNKNVLDIHGNSKYYYPLETVNFSYLFKLQRNSSWQINLINPLVTFLTLSSIT